jgi:hypothetical protein
MYTGEWFFRLKRYFTMGLPAGWLFSLQKKGHSRIPGTVNFGFIKKGVLKQVWNDGVHILRACIFINHYAFHKSSWFI